MFQSAFYRKVRYKTWLLLLCLVTQLSLIAQTKTTISGTVTDQHGAPLPSASVQIRNSKKATTTDEHGRFIFTVPEQRVSLVITMTGYADVSVIAEAGKPVKVTMTPSAKDLDDVVVVAYGKQKKANVVGSVAQISGDQLKQMPAMNVTNMLAGRLPGLTVLQTSGQPGNDDATLRVRGTGTYGTDANGASIAGPLVIIDNVARPSFANLDPNEIESVTVLKDAVSTAVYGLQAANGIILITTKRGKNQRAIVSYDGAVTQNTNTRFPKFLNGPDYMTWYNKGTDMDNDYLSHTFANPVPYIYTKKQIDDVRSGRNKNPLLGNTDWVGEMVDRRAVSQQHTVTVRGGTDKVKYFSTLGYLDQEGVVNNTNFKRYNARTNLDAQLNDYLSVALDLSVRQQLGRTPGLAPDNGAYFNPFYQAVRTLPNMPMYAPNGLPTASQSGAGWVNPIASVNQSGYQRTETNVFQGNITMNFKVPGVKGLEAKLLTAYDKTGEEKKGWVTPYPLMGRARDQVTGDYTMIPTPPGITKNTLRQSYGQNSRVTFQPSISYNNRFGDHAITALALYEWSQYKNNIFSTGASNFTLTDIQDINFGSTAQLDWISPTGYSGIDSRAGFVGRINYMYKDRYLLEIANRFDASIRFAPNHRWQAFPAAALGWIVSKESFFEPLSSVVSFLKLKGSVGRLGNDKGARTYSYLQTFTLTKAGDTYPTTVIGGVPVATLYPSAPPNPNLQWESSTMINGGFESVLWNGGLSVDFEWFYKLTTDIIADATNLYPLSFGGYYPTSVNNGKVGNRGFDLQLRHRGQVGDFHYGITGNLNWAKNKILKLNESAGLPAWQRKTGRSIGEKFGFIVDGLYQNWDEASNASSPSGGVVAPGFFKYRDLNGDGRITRDADMTFIGRSNIPELMYGISLDAQYKGFDFSALFQGAALCNVSLGGLYEGSSNTSGVEDNTPFTRTFYNYGNSPYFLVEEAWTPDNPGAKMPRLSAYKATMSAHNANANSGFMRDGSYLRLKSVQLGYTLPGKWLSSAKIQSVRVYVSGFNLATWDKLKYMDPEMPNVNNGFYPQQKMYSGGLNITF